MSQFTKNKGKVPKGGTSLPQVGQDLIKGIDKGNPRVLLKLKAFPSKATAVETTIFTVQNIIWLTANEKRITIFCLFQR